jgi:hypothetical protein
MIWYIDEDLTTGLNDGSSWANAFKSVTIDAVPNIPQLIEDSSIILRSTGVVDIHRDFGGLGIATFTLDIILEEGSELYYTGAYSYPVTINYAGTAGRVNVRNFNITQSDANGYGMRVANPDTAGTTYIYNIKVSGGSGFYITAVGTTYIKGFVIHGAKRGVRNTAAGTVNASNGYSDGSTAAYVNDVAGTLNLTSCASNDATGSVGLQNIPYDATAFVDITLGAEDLHLADGSPLIGVGTVDDNIVDFAGTSWGTPRDIGVYNYSEGGAPSYVFIQTSMDGGFSALDGGF